MVESSIYVGLDIGTTKVCAAVAECCDREGLRLLGVGGAKFRGLSEGETLNIGEASTSIQEAISSAEGQSGVKIWSVFLGITDSHVEGMNVSGAVAIPREVGKVTEQEIRDAESQAKDLHLPDPERAILHTFLQQFCVDEVAGLRDPEGLNGRRLQADFHSIVGIRDRIQKAVCAVKQCRTEFPDIEIEDVVSSSLASAHAVLHPQQMDGWALVVDIGGAVTSYIAYCRGAVIHSGVVPVGGIHITNDISKHLQIPLDEAEKLKIEDGLAIDGEPKPGRFAKKSDHERLNQVIHTRLADLLSQLRQRIGNRVPLSRASEVFLTGGSSKMPGIRALAESIFQIPVHLANANGISGPQSVIGDPRFATCLGLVKIGLSSRECE